MMPRDKDKMTEALVYRHGLEQLLGTLPQISSDRSSQDRDSCNRDSNGSLLLTVHTGSAFFNLRGAADHSGFVAATGQATGQQLPLQPNTFSHGPQRIFWQGPDEWLIEAPVESAEALLASLHSALAGVDSSATDISGGIISLTLCGEHARDLLAKGCTLDLHPDEFKAGDCAQTGLAKANVLIARLAAPERYVLLVRRTFADYLVQWLHHAGREFDIGFVQQ
jgi:sarcosine oxidase subunit gamma